MMMKTSRLHIKDYENAAGYVYLCTHNLETLYPNVCVTKMMETRRLHSRIMELHLGMCTHNIYLHVYTTGIYLRLRERKNTFGCCFHLSYPPRQQLVCFVYKMVSCLLECAPLPFPGCFFALFKILPFCSLALSKTLPCSL